MEFIFQKEVLKDVAQMFASGTAGYLLFFITSHPRLPIRQKMPNKKVWKIHILPCIKLTVKDRDIHFHHWINLSVLYAILFISSSQIIRHEAIQGFFLGGIVQGLTFKDRFKIIHRPLAKQKNGR